MKPTMIDIEKTRKNYVDLFTKEDLEETIPYDFDYEGDEVEDGVPDEEEIHRAVFRMRSRKAPGLTGVSVDHIKLWYKLAYPSKGEKDYEALALWEKW